MGRLERLLTSHGLLKDGRIAPAAAGVPVEDVARISSIVFYLRDTEKHLALAPWFEDSEFDLANGADAPEIVEAMGLSYMLHPNATPRFHFYGQPTYAESQPSALSDVRGFDLMGRVALNSLLQPLTLVLTDEAAGEDYRLAFEPASGLFSITGPDGRALAFDLNAFAGTLTEPGLTRSVKDLWLEGTEGPLRARLIFERLSGRLESGQPKVHDSHFLLLIDRDHESD